MTARNTEKTGRRHVTFLSRLARTIEGVRHIDIDLEQYCPACKRPEVFAEVKSRLISQREWEMTRRHASYYGHGCLAILVIEATGSLGVVVYDSADESVSAPVWEHRSDDGKYLTSVLERARDIHACW